MLDEMRSEAKALAKDISHGEGYLPELCREYNNQWGVSWARKRDAHARLCRLIDSRTTYDDLHELLRLLRGEWDRQNPTTENSQ